MKGVAFRAVTAFVSVCLYPEKWRRTTGSSICANHDEEDVRRQRVDASSSLLLRLRAHNLTLASQCEYHGVRDILISSVRLFCTSSHIQSIHMLWDDNIALTTWVNNGKTWMRERAFCSEKKWYDILLYRIRGHVSPQSSLRLKRRSCQPFLPVVNQIDVPVEMKWEYALRRDAYLSTTYIAVYETIRSVVVKARYSSQSWTCVSRSGSCFGSQSVTPDVFIRSSS